MSLFRLLFGWHGRIGRKQYWLGFATAYGVAIAIVVGIGFMLFTGFQQSGDGIDKGEAIVGVMGLGLVVVVLHCVATFSLFAIVVKRLHDLGLSGFWSLALTVPPHPVAAYSAYSALQTNDFTSPLHAPGYSMILLTVLASIGLIVLGMIPGQMRDNQHGPALRQPPAAPPRAAPEEHAVELVSPPANPISFGRKPAH